MGRTHRPTNGGSAAGHRRALATLAVLASIGLALGSLVLGTVGAAAADPQLSVDFAPATSPGSIRHVGSGFLHPFSTAFGPAPSIAPAGLFTALAPKVLRCRAGALVACYNEDKALRGGSTDAIFIGTLSGDWGYPGHGDRYGPPWGADYDNPDYGAWLRMVVSVVGGIKAVIPVEQRVYDFWNEGNGPSWWSDWDSREASNGFPRYKAMYRLTHQLLKTGLPGYNNGQPLDPQARFTAPATGGGDGETAWTKDFMRFAVDNGVVPDFWNWHFGGLSIPSHVANRLGYAQSLGVHRDAMILEYLTEGSGKRPGRTAHELALLEKAGNHGDGPGLIGAAHARWPTTSEMGDTLFYADGAWRRHGVWHVYAAYGAMRGRLGVTSASGAPRLEATATADPERRTASLLIGNETSTSTAGIGTTTLKVKGLEDVFRNGRAWVTATRIPYRDDGEVTEADLVTTIGRRLTAFSNGVLTLSLPWGPATDAYLVVLTAE